MFISNTCVVPTRQVTTTVLCYFTADQSPIAYRLPYIAPILGLLTLHMDPEISIYDCSKKLNVDAFPFESLAGDTFLPAMSLSHLAKVQKRWQVWTRVSQLARMAFLNPLKVQVLHSDAEKATKQRDSHNGACMFSPDSDLIKTCPILPLETRAIHSKTRGGWIGGPSISSLRSI
ncbi:hypothetical protein FIBSPDRAFT_857225 [Athelia psychrophila]|uniref:Uncharacterized protein n=1 Tax=Athelia psychrophila TaxID=1759441 RepID=A0A166MQ06_9AGAM|nr:hypothetical protein FIBSPDRAFT_857225 [Fibularhizoctonia sp. CBS 109695]